MSEQETEAVLAEIDRLLNDPLTGLDGARVWSLLEQVAGRVPVALAA